MPSNYPEDAAWEAQHYLDVKDVKRAMYEDHAGTHQAHVEATSDVKSDHYRPAYRDPDDDSYGD